MTPREHDDTTDERVTRLEVRVEQLYEKCSEYTNTCAHHRAECAEQRQSAHQTCNGALCGRLARVEEQAAAVGRARLISAWVWQAIATAGGAIVAGLGMYEIVARLIGN